MSMNADRKEIKTCFVAKSQDKMKPNKTEIFSTIPLLYQGNTTYCCDPMPPLVAAKP
jgi:hypothetical protein